MRILQTDTYARWFAQLRDVRAKARIDARIRRVSLGNLGDSKSVGGGLHELRVDYGPGYRVYFLSKAGVLIVLLCGGDKSRQSVDIAEAQRIAAEWKGAQ